MALCSIGIRSFWKFSIKIMNNKSEFMWKKIVTLYCNNNNNKKWNYRLEISVICREKNSKKNAKSLIVVDFLKWIQFEYDAISVSISSHRMCAHIFFELKFAGLMRKSVCSFPWISLFLCTVADKIIKMAAQCDSWNWQKRENDMQILAQLAWYIFVHVRFA